MTIEKKANFLVKFNLRLNNIVSGADICGNQATDVKRRVWLALPQKMIL